MNILYRSISGFGDCYKVIKVLGRYRNTPSNAFIKYDPGSGTTEPVLSAKVIYNVKKKEAILERMKYDEVIEDGKK